MDRNTKKNDVNMFHENPQISRFLCQTKNTSMYHFLLIPTLIDDIILICNHYFFCICVSFLNHGEWWRKPFPSEVSGNDGPSSFSLGVDLLLRDLLKIEFCQTIHNHTCST
jgi:hypothetical protein